MIHLTDRINQQHELATSRTEEVLHEHRAVVTERMDRLIELSLTAMGVHPHLVSEAQLRERVACHLDGLVVLLLRKGLITNVEVEAAKLEGVMCGEVGLRAALNESAGLALVKG